MEAHIGQRGPYRKGAIQFGWRSLGGLETLTCALRVRKQVSVSVQLVTPRACSPRLFMKAAGGATVHLLMRPVAAVNPHNRGLVTIRLRIPRRATQRFRPVRGQPLGVSRVVSMAEGVAHDLVRHHPGVPCPRQIPQTVVTTHGLVHRLHRPKNGMLRRLENFLSAATHRRVEAKPQGEAEPIMHRRGAQSAQPMPKVTGISKQSTLLSPEFSDSRLAASAPRRWPSSSSSPASTCDDGFASGGASGCQRGSKGSR